jgi:hypothetical protein
MLLDSTFSHLFAGLGGGFGLQGLRFRVNRFGSRVKGLGFRSQG